MQDGPSILRLADRIATRLAVRSAKSRCVRDATRAAVKFTKTACTDSQSAMTTESHC